MDSTVLQERLVDYENEYESRASNYQVLWSATMDKGTYRKPSSYKKIAVLMLYWKDLLGSWKGLKKEIDGLKAVFKEDFNWIVDEQGLDFTSTGVEIELNYIVAGFVREHKTTNTLLIVYYAGHGLPSDVYGGLTLSGDTSPPAEEKKTIKPLWNDTEKLLKVAIPDVLEIFDCCYSGNLALVRGEDRAFEYLAATGAHSTTPGPGPRSFTTALIKALQHLVKEKERFTTVDLVQVIRSPKYAPDFPRDQHPVLSNRESDRTTGRIMLHRIPKPDSSVTEPSITEPATTPNTPTFNQDIKKLAVVTLHFDFQSIPPEADIEVLGEEINDITSRRKLGINRVRWGGIAGMQPYLVREAAERFLAPVRKRRESDMPNQRPNGPPVLTPSRTDSEDTDENEKSEKRDQKKRRTK